MGSQQQVQPDVPTTLKPILNQAYGDIGPAQTLNPGTYTMTPMQQQIQGSASSLLGAGGPLSSVSSYLSNLFSPGYTNPMSNPNMQAALNAGQNTFQQGLNSSLDSLGSIFGASGQNPANSGEFMQQGSNLAQAALGNYGNSVSNLLMNQYNTSAGQQAQGLSGLGSVANTLGSLGGIASLPQELATQQQQGQIQLDQIPFNELLALMGQTPVSNPSFEPSQLQQILGMLPGLGSLAGGAGSLIGALG